MTARRDKTFHAFVAHRRDGTTAAVSLSANGPLDARAWRAILSHINTLYRAHLAQESPNGFADIEGTPLDGEDSLGPEA